MKSKPCVLIVDDDPGIRETMRDAIVSWHCAALAAASGEETLNILDHRRVDVMWNCLCLEPISKSIS